MQYATVLSSKTIWYKNDFAGNKYAFHVNRKKKQLNEYLHFNLFMVPVDGRSKSFHQFEKLCTTHPKIIITMMHKSQRGRNK